MEVGLAVVHQAGAIAEDEDLLSGFETTTAAGGLKPGLNPAGVLYASEGCTSSDFAYGNRFAFSKYT